MNKMIQWQVAKARELSDKAVSEFLPKNELLRWSGRPGFVATFNSREVLFSIIATVVITIIVVVIMGTPPPVPYYSAQFNDSLPLEFYALMSVTFCGLTLLFIGWVRQVCRYITTIGMYYAVTDSRLVIIKHGEIVSQLPIELIKTLAVSKKMFGNGSVVFNEGEDYFKENLLESPPKNIFAFFNVLDVDNVKACLNRL